MHTRLFVTLSVAAILAAATLPYISTWSDPFIADDWSHLLHSKHLTLETFSYNCSFSRYDIFYRPVSIAYFYLNYLAWGMEPTGHHVVKGLLFAGSSVLLFVFILRTTGFRVAALIAALVFALHPLNTSSAVWLATHANVLCIFFYLLALVLFVEARKARRGSVPLYVGFLASMLLCFGSYELGYTLPVMVLLTDLLLVREQKSARPREALLRGLLRHLPYIAVAIAFFLARFLLMERTFQPDRSLAEAIAVVPRQVIEVLFLPIGRSDLEVTPFMRTIPVLVGLTLFLWLLIMHRELRRPAIFAVPWYILGIFPTMRFSNLGPAMENTRFLIMSTPSFAMVIGLFVCMFWRNVITRLVAGVCVATVLLGFLFVSFQHQARWTEEAMRTQRMVDSVSEIMEGEEMPSRLVFVTYPPPIPGVTQSEPVFILAALQATEALPLLPRPPMPPEIRPSPYIGDIPENMPEVLEEVIRWFPVQLNSDVLHERGTFRREDDVYSIARGDLERTFFFYWSEQGGTLADCTEPMRARLAQDRRAELFHWTAREKFPYARVAPADCSWSPQHEKGILYISPTPGILSFPMLQIDLEGADCMDFDQVEIEMSAASKSSREGFFTAFVTWQWEGEEASPDALHEHAVAFSGRYHPYHKFRHYRVPMAYHFLKSGSRRIASLYIVFSPNVSETAIRSVRLSRFTR